jgi:hypothetical protein
MVGARPLVTASRIEGPLDARLGRYQSLVVTLIAGLILALTSVPGVVFTLR